MFPELEYLHDCALLEIKYDLTDAANRRLMLVVEAPDDLGYQPWEGKTLSIMAAGVYLFHYMAWGHVNQQEVLDTWSESISDQTRVQLSRHESLGLAVPNTKYTVTFHSGSYFEVVCQTLTVDAT